MNFFLGVLLANLFVYLSICNAEVSLSNDQLHSSVSGSSRTPTMKVVTEFVDMSSGQNKNLMSTVKPEVNVCPDGQVMQPSKLKNISIDNEKIFIQMKNVTKKVGISIPSSVYSIQGLVHAIDVLVRNFSVKSLKIMRPKWQLYYIEETDSICSIRNDSIKLQLSKKLMKILGMNIDDELPESETNIKPFFGLQNCYCNECDPSKTVGKVFEDKCYFLTTEDDVRLDTRTRTLHTDRFNYSVFIGESSMDEILTEQIAVEIVLRNIRPSVRVALGLRLNGNVGVRCLQVFRRKWTAVECKTFMPIILVANVGKYKLHAKYEIPDYPKCKFDKEAVNSSFGEERCYKIMNKTKCRLVEIKNMKDLENIQKYLVNIAQNRLSENRTHDMRVTYRIKDIVPDLRKNEHYLVFSRVESQRKGNKCMYMNPFSKTILYDLCEFSAESICELSPSDVPRNIEYNVSKLTRFAVYFLASVAGMCFVLLIIAFILFGPLKNFWKPTSTRHTEDLEDRTPIYRAGKMECVINNL